MPRNLTAIIEGDPHISRSVDFLQVADDHAAFGIER